MGLRALFYNTFHEMSQLIGDHSLLQQDESEIKGSEALKDKVVALYFSAMWCGQCRQFTPKLERFYKALKESGKPFEVILVTRDHEEEDMLEYFKEHNGEWLAVKFGDDLIPELLEKYQVSSIPAMRIIKPDGSVAEENPMAQVKERGAHDPEELFDEWAKAAL